MGNREFKGITLPKGVKVNQDNGREPRVEIRFTYRKVECRELSLEATKQNIEYAGGVVAKVRHLIELGQFRYGEHFPESKRCALFNEHAPKETSVKVLLDDFLAHIKPLVSSRTHAHYGHVLELYVRPAWDSRTADKLTIPNMLEWLKELAAQGKGKGLSLSTARTVLIPFNSALNHGVLMQRIDTNPLKAISVAKVWPKDQRETGYEPDPFTDDERAKVLKACKSDEMRRFLTFWLWTGLRGEEIIALQWSRVDLEKKRIFIDHVSRDGVIVKDTKTPASKRHVPLFGPALKAIQEQRATTQLKGHGFVWECPTTGKPWAHTERLKNTSWVNLLKRAGVRYRGPYQCRHTFASTMFANGEPLPTVSKILGHKNPGITLKFYTRMIESTATHNEHGFDVRGNYDKVAA